ncbi:MAG: bifunctional riboflavin kinase/FAD synthetase [Lachnospiraceae bacterium]|nr:bifunctional riboflavin kinase/FAD synthetase [Lachnospiraceae bacterium]
MRIIKDINKLNIAATKAAIALGKFDGIHLGHRRLIDEVIKRKENGLLSAIITFDPSPEVYFGKSNDRKILLNNEMEAFLRELGIDLLIYFPMNKETVKIAPTTFITDFLINKLKMAFICAGDDLHFGDAGRGNSDLLTQMSEELGFETLIIPKICLNEREISTTYAKAAIEKSDMELAAAILGYHFEVSGKVLPGMKLGRTLGFPTANLLPPPDKILPPPGVYICSVKTTYGILPGICNVGVKPTIEGEHSLSVETHIYDFAGDLYEQEIVVSFLKFVRPEKKFADINALKVQVLDDMRKGREYFSGR